MSNYIIYFCPQCRAQLLSNERGMNRKCPRCFSKNAFRVEIFDIETTIKNVHRSVSFQSSFVLSNYQLPKNIRCLIPYPLIRNKRIIGMPPLPKTSVRSKPS